METKHAQENLHKTELFTFTRSCPLSVYYDYMCSSKKLNNRKVGMFVNTITHLESTHKCTAFGFS